MFFVVFLPREIITDSDNKNIHLKTKSVMRIDLDKWAKDYAKRKKKDKRKSPMAKLHGLYKGKIFISKDAFDYRIIPLNELPN
jgi:hypothetical protein